MSLVLDTSIVVALSKNEKGTINLVRELKIHYPETPAIAFMVYMEYYEGLLGKNEKNQQQHLIFLRSFPLLLPKERTAELLAELKRKYEKHGRSFGFADFLIAAQCIENGMTLVTKDAAFNEIKELKKIIV